MRPAAAWIAELARDAAALQPYGLTLADLHDFGTPPREIAAHMNEALAQRELFSAVPEDEARIRRLFDAAKMAPEFALRRSNADEVIAELARLRRLPPAAAVHARRERGRSHVPDWPPRRSEGALPRDLLEPRHRVGLAAACRPGPAPLAPKPHRARTPRRRPHHHTRRLFPCPANKPKSSHRPC